MRHLLILLFLGGMSGGFMACSGSSATTYQTNTPPPPVAGGPGARPVIYDPATPGGQLPPAPLPATSDASTPEAPVATLPYTVMPGDSLWKIAQQHRTSVAKIQAINKLIGDTIRPGQVLQIPAP